MKKKADSEKQKIWKSIEFQFTDEEKELFLSLMPQYDYKRNLVLKAAIQRILAKNGYSNIEV